MTQKPEVICIGQAVVDCITRGIQEDSQGLGKTRARSITLNPGGDALNEAAVLARKGRRVRLVCGVGEDPAGDLLVQTALRRGIQTEGITTVPGMVTPIANMFVKLDGARSSITSEATLLPGYLPDPEMVRGAGVVSFASLFRAPLDQPGVVCRLIRAAKESGALVCADTKLPTFRKISLEDLAEILPMIDYFFPNEQEALYYSGCSDLQAAGESLRSRGIRHVIIKTGEKGCIAFSECGSFAMPAIPVPVVDTTGAGDSFAAGFIDGLLRGGDLEFCCRAGLEAAAEGISHLGGTM